MRVWFISAVSRLLLPFSSIVCLQQNELVFLQYIKKQDTYIKFSGKVCVNN
jgi:hypothetical protein